VYHLIKIQNPTETDIIVYNRLIFVSDLLENYIALWEGDSWVFPEHSA